MANQFQQIPTMGYQQMPQMVQMPQPQIESQLQQNNITLIRVSSFDAVKNWQVPPGMAVPFMHATKPFMFIKTAPSSPFEQPSIDIFKISKVDSMDDDLKESSEVPYVTRKEYNELKDEIRSLKERMKPNESIYRKPKKCWSDSNKRTNKPTEQSDANDARL